MALVDFGVDLYCLTDVREITFTDRILDNSLMSAVVIPSENHSWDGS